MGKLRLIFIVSLLILVGALVATIYLIPPRQNYTDSRRIQIIEAQNEWILQCVITNGQEKSIKYSILINIDGDVYSDSTVISPKKTYTYIHHIYPQQLKEGKVNVTLYEEGKTEPIEQTTYYLERK